MLLRKVSDARLGGSMGTENARKGVSEGEPLGGRVLLHGTFVLPTAPAVCS